MEKNTWLLRLEGSQFGPFAPDEIKKILDSGKLTGTIYACRLGMRNWFVLTNITQITQGTSTTWDEDSPSAQDAAGKRTGLRIAMIATVSKKTQSGNQMIGVCADISKGGMQVINSTHTQFVRGEILDLMVNPLIGEGMEPFTSEAKVAWIDETSHKVGFQFLDFDSNTSLQIYIQKSDKV